MSSSLIPEKEKEGSQHLQDEGVCDVPFPEKKREKSGHLQNEG